MDLKLVILYIFDVLTVNAFEVFSINDGYRGIVEKIESRAIQFREYIEEKWIEQQVDNFDESDSRTWKMRYYRDRHFWKPDGPVYLFINGEAVASPSFLTTGVVYDLAKETGGAMYLSEHRYYGKSQPVNRSQFNVENMRFLSAAQAMADNAKLLRTIKNDARYNNSKVVIVGGSYAGNLVAWMKLVYSDIVDAAISSSGPVLAKRDFYEYLEVVGNDYIKFGPPDCIEKIKHIFQRYDELLQTDNGIDQLKKEMNICEETDMKRLENRQVFFSAKTIAFMSKAQYGITNDIVEHCSKLKDPQGTQVLLDKKYNWRYDKKCFDYDFDNMIREYRDPKNDEMLCWTYQTCTEFGYFQSGTSDKQPFTHNIAAEWYELFCKVLFGADFDEDRVNKGVKKTNEMYGGKTPNVTRVVFVNGEMDPWSSLGVEKGSIDAPVVYIPKSSHCRDLMSNEPDDDEEIKEARARIKDQIKRWIGVVEGNENKVNKT